jgi:hypothetical protein
MYGRSVSAMLLSVLLAGVAFAESESTEPVNDEVEVKWEAASNAISNNSETDPSFSSSNGRIPSSLAGSVELQGTSMTDTFNRPSSSAFKAFGVGMFIAAGADLASTEFGLSQPGTHEVNPLQGDRTVRALTHAAVPVFMYWATEKMRDQGKPKLALLTRIGFTVAYSYVVMHNLRTTASNP